jgi:hypothetical protein
MKKVLLVLTVIGFIVGTIFAVSAAAYWVGNLLGPWAWATNLLVLIFGFVMIIATVLTMAERKWSAMIQDRIGPNRARFGLPGLRNNPLGEAASHHQRFGEDAHQGGLPAQARRPLPCSTSGPSWPSPRSSPSSRSSSPPGR